VFDPSTFSFKVGTWLDGAKPLVIPLNNFDKFLHRHVTNIRRADDDDRPTPDGDLEWVDGLDGFIKELSICPIIIDHGVSRRCAVAIDGPRC